MSIIYDRDMCVGCNRCADACQVEVLVHTPEAAKPPIVLYPEECWYCGCCVMECPNKAIKLRHPLMNRAKWVERSSLSSMKEGRGG